MPHQQLSPAVVAGTALASLAVPLLVPDCVAFTLPVAGALINLQWMYDEYYYLRSWSTAADRPGVDQQLGTWYSSWRGSIGPLPSVVGLPMMWSGAGRFLYHNRNAGLDAINISYAVGLALAVWHIPAGGKAFPLLKTVADGKDGAMKALEKWLGMHVKRIWTVDAPALAAFAYGMYLVLS